MALPGSIEFVMRSTSLRVLPVLSLTIACSAGGGLSLGNNGQGTGGTSAGGSAGNAGVLNVGGEQASKALEAHIESPRGVTVDVITVSCSGACAQVEAVAEGGFAPYTYTWDD